MCNGENKMVKGILYVGKAGARKLLIDKGLSVLDLSRKTQSRLHAEIAHAAIATMNLCAFIFDCMRLHLHTFVSTFRDRPRTGPCVSAYSTLTFFMTGTVRMYIMYVSN